MTMLRATLVVGFMIAGAHSAGAWIHGHSMMRAVASFSPNPPIPAGNTISGYAPDQTIHTTVDAVSYLTIYGSFSNVSSASVQTVDCDFDASISYWDRGTVVIRLVSLGPPNLDFVAAGATALGDETITVTVTNPGPPAEVSSPPLGSDPQPDLVP